MNSYFWSGAHEHLTNNTDLPNNGCNYKICQVKDDNEYSKYFDKNGNVFIKESRFSYIWPVDGRTRLIVYNGSNITGLESIVHRGSKIDDVVSNGFMIIFTDNTFHVGAKSYERLAGNYSDRLRMFVYIVVKKYISIKDEISKLLNDNKCLSIYETCEAIPNENINYEGHITRYVDTYFSIDNLAICKVLLGDL